MGTQIKCKIQKTGCDPLGVMQREELYLLWHSKIQSNRKGPIPSWPLAWDVSLKTKEIPVSIAFLCTKVEKQPAAGSPSWRPLNPAPWMAFLRIHYKTWGPNKIAGWTRSPGIVSSVPHSKSHSCHHLVPQVRTRGKVKKAAKLERHSALARGLKRIWKIKLI